MYSQIRSIRALMFRAGMLVVLPQVTLPRVEYQPMNWAAFLESRR